MHDCTSKGLKQSAVMKISNMIVRRFIIFFCLIMKITPSGPTPIWPGIGGGVCTPPVNSSLSEATKVVYATYYTVNLTDSNQCGNIHLPEINQECCAIHLSHYLLYSNKLYFQFC